MGAAAALLPPKEIFSDEEDVVGICGSWGLALLGGGGGGVPFDFSPLFLLELESLRN